MTGSDAVTGVTGADAVTGAMEFELLRGSVGMAITCPGCREVLDVYRACEVTLEARSPAYDDWRPVRGYTVCRPCTPEVVARLRSAAERSKLETRIVTITGSCFQDGVRVSPEPDWEAQPEPRRLGPSVQVDGPALIGAIRFVLPCVPKGERVKAYPHLVGVHLEVVEHGVVEVVATDGVRIGLVRLEIPSLEAPVGAGSTLALGEAKWWAERGREDSPSSVLSPQIGWSKAEGGASLSLWRTEACRSEEAQSGRFVDYRKAVPASLRAEHVGFVLDRRDLLRALDRVRAALAADREAKMAQWRTEYAEAAALEAELATAVKSQGGLRRCRDGKLAARLRAARADKKNAWAARPVEAGVQGCRVRVICDGRGELEIRPNLAEDSAEAARCRVTADAIHGGCDWPEPWTEEFGVNPDYLKETVRAVQAERIVLWYRAPVSVLWVCSESLAASASEGRPALLRGVMPVRLSR